MYRHLLLRRAAMSGAIVALGFFALQPAYAQMLAAVAAAATNAGPSAACNVTLDQVRLDLPLVHTARVLASGKPLKIVALGSSSTYGAGASTSAASYPSRLADELARRFPGHEIAILNRGVNGNEAADMLARLDAARPAST
jgi:acyl-CoA thioesterase-1